MTFRKDSSRSVQLLPAAASSRREGEATYPSIMPTRLAYQYCGFESPSSLRKAKHDGKVVALGRRGGGGTLMWRKRDLDDFIAGRIPASESSTVANDERSTRSTK